MASYSDTKEGPLLLRPNVPLHYVLYYPDQQRLTNALTRCDIKRGLYGHLLTSLRRLGSYCVGLGHGPRMSLQVARAVLRGGKVGFSAPTARRHIDLLSKFGVLMADGPGHVCLRAFGRLGRDGDSHLVMLPGADDPFWVEHQEARKLKKRKQDTVRRKRHRAKVKKLCCEESQENSSETKTYKEETRSKRTEGKSTATNEQESVALISGANATTKTKASKTSTDRVKHAKNSAQATESKNSGPPITAVVHARMRKNIPLFIPAEEIDEIDDLLSQKENEKAPARKTEDDVPACLDPETAAFLRRVMSKKPSEEPSLTSTPSPASEAPQVPQKAKEQHVAKKLPALPMPQVQQLYENHLSTFESGPPLNLVAIAGEGASYDLTREAFAITDEAVKAGRVVKGAPQIINPGGYLLGTLRHLVSGTCRQRRRA